QRVNFNTHCRASSRLLKPLDGHSGRYLQVLNCDSANGLSLLTRGRLYEVVTPSSYALARIVCDFIGAPLSECNTKPVCKQFSRNNVRCKSSAASSPDSCS